MSSIDNFDVSSSSNVKDINDILFHRTGGLVILQWNINNYSYNVKIKLHYIIATKKPVVLLIQEANIHYQDCSFTFNIDGYITYSQTNGHGKVLTLVKMNLSHHHIYQNIPHNKQINKKIKKLNCNDSDFK